MFFNNANSLSGFGSRPGGRVNIGGSTNALKIVEKIQARYSAGANGARKKDSDDDDDDDDSIFKGLKQNASKFMKQKKPATPQPDDNDDDDEEEDEVTSDLEVSAADRSSGTPQLVPANRARLTPQQQKQKGRVGSPVSSIASLHRRSTSKVKFVHDLGGGGGGGSQRGASDDDESTIAEELHRNVWDADQLEALSRTSSRASSPVKKPSRLSSRSPLAGKIRSESVASIAEEIGGEDEVFSESTTTDAAAGARNDVSSRERVMLEFGDPMNFGTTEFFVPVSPKPKSSSAKRESGVDRDRRDRDRDDRSESPTQRSSSRRHKRSHHKKDKKDKRDKDDEKKTKKHHKHRKDEDRDEKSSKSKSKHKKHRHRSTSTSEKKSKKSHNKKSSSRHRRRSSVSTTSTLSNTIKSLSRLQMEQSTDTDIPTDLNEEDDEIATIISGSSSHSRSRARTYSQSYTSTRTETPSRSERKRSFRTNNTNNQSEAQSVRSRSYGTDAFDTDLESTSRHSVTEPTGADSVSQTAARKKQLSFADSSSHHHHGGYQRARAAGKSSFASKPNSTAISTSNIEIQVDPADLLKHSDLIKSVSVYNPTSLMLASVAHFNDTATLRELNQITGYNMISQAFNDLMKINLGFVRNFLSAQRVLYETQIAEIRPRPSDS